MAFTLIEYMKTTTSELLQGVLEKFARTSPILEQMPFKEIIGNALTYNKEHTLPGIAFRGVNEAYSEDTGIVNPETETLKIMGGDADTDRALQKWEKNFGERRATDLMMKVKAAALYFSKCFFDGDEASDPREFDGLNIRLTGDQLILAPEVDSTRPLTMSLMNQLIDAVTGKPDALYCSKKFRRQINDLAEDSTILGITKNEFGEEIQAFAGVPIHIIEEDNNDDTILAFDETANSTTSTASIYAVKFGVDQYLCGLQTEPLEAYDLGELETKPAFRSRIEWLIAIAIFHAKSAARLYGVTATVS